jgi:hypothetical protein
MHRVNDVVIKTKENLITTLFCCTIIHQHQQEGTMEIGEPEKIHEDVKAPEELPFHITVPTTTPIEVPEEQEVPA